VPIEIAGITLHRIHKIATLERADFVRHRVPGLEGNLVQDMGRDSVQLQIEGIFYGATAQDDLEQLRSAQKAREPVDFLADVVGQAYFSQVVLHQLDVFQRAEEPEQYSYTLVIAEYVPPPEPESGLGLDLPGVDAAIGLEALDFMDVLQLPDMLAIPELEDPTKPLSGLVDTAQSALSALNGQDQIWNEIFGN
jgi:DNA circularisation protein N-terminus